MRMRSIYRLEKNETVKFLIYTRIFERSRPRSEHAPPRGAERRSSLCASESTNSITERRGGADDKRFLPEVETMVAPRVVIPINGALRLRWKRTAIA